MQLYGVLGVFFGVAIFFIGLVVILSLLLSPRSRPMDRAKKEPYESGIIPRMPADIPIPVRFYRVALLFLIFDVEIAFLYPWALKARDLGVLGLVEIAIFVGMLLLGYVYYWKRGGLQWE